MRIHLVYPGEYVEFKQALIEAGHEVVAWDYTLEQFRDFSELRQTSAEVALINGVDGLFNKQRIISLLREIRVNLDGTGLRLIVQFPAELENDKRFISELVSLGIYDLYFTDEFDMDDVEEWLNNPKTLAHYYGQEPARPEPVRSEPVARSEPVRQIAPELPTNKEVTIRNQPTFSTIIQVITNLLSKIGSRSRIGQQTKAPVLALPSPRETLKTRPSSPNKGKRSLDEIFGVATPKTNENLTIQTIEIPKAKNEKPEKPKILGFFSGTKGSCGKTTLATNTVAILSQNGYRVALIDADQYSRGATVASYVNEPLPKRADRLGKDVWIFSREDANIEKLKDEFDYIVIDFGNLITTELLNILKECDVLFLVTIPETLSISIIHRFMQKEGKVLDNIQLVINRYVVGRGITPWDVASRMGLEPKAIIPDDIEHIEMAVNKRTVAVNIKGNAISEPLTKLLQKSKIL